MKQSIEKLQKFFKLEADRGYDNKAVMGGLSRMLDTWISDARGDELDENLIQAIISRLNDYDHLSEESRKEALHGIWNRIKRDLDSNDYLVEEEKIITEVTTDNLTTTQSEEKDSIHQLETLEIHPDENDSEKPKSPSRPKPYDTPAALDAEVSVLNNVGPRYAKTLERLGIKTLGDMIYHFPHRYDDYSQLKPINRLRIGEEVTVIGSIQSVIGRSIRSGSRKISEVVMNDGSASIKITWFNQPWIAQRLKKGMQIVISGKVNQYLGRLTMNNPEWEPLEQKNLHTNRILPVYPLTSKITQRWLRNLLYKVITFWASKVVDHLPTLILESAGLIDLSTALEQIHFPDSWKQLESAQYRLAFDEIFLLQLGVLQQKQSWQERAAHKYEVSDQWINQKYDKLPYSLTTAQNNAINDIRRDLCSGHPMNRLLQGDVGSGKTIIAAFGIALVTSNGPQAAVMAPTSILAEQHYSTLRDVLSNEDGILRPDEIRLLLGATGDSEKKEIIEGIQSGDIKLLIGTHALIEDPIEFKNLQLVIIDEQHRFGVNQRAALRIKGSNPHLLVMTATPIPRSLALTIYGDLDISILDEMPPGRQGVDTHILYPSERERAYRLIHNQLISGFQAFIVYPLVEDSGNSEDKAAVDEQIRIQNEIFPNFQVGLLHGRMKATEKEEVMTRFRRNDYQVLVSTSVVEVGVDIPNATIILIEGAHRFGLAQLHQLRGRVGRGKSKAYCLLIPSSSDDVDNERLKAMVDTNDGFILAEKDLENRGAGDFLGTRQSGFSELKFAKLTDLKLIEKARFHACELFKVDPELAQQENRPLVEAMNRFWKNGQGDLS